MLKNLLDIGKIALLVKILNSFPCEKKIWILKWTLRGVVSLSVVWWASGTRGWLSFGMSNSVIFYGESLRAATRCASVEIGLATTCRHTLCLGRGDPLVSPESHGRRRGGGGAVPGNLVLP